MKKNLYRVQGHYHGSYLNYVVAESMADASRTWEGTNKIELVAKDIIIK